MNELQFYMQIALMRRYRKVIHTDTYGGKRLRSVRLRTPRLVLISRSNAVDESDRR
jgi:hypothetical protein